MRYYSVNLIFDMFLFLIKYSSTEKIISKKSKIINNKLTSKKWNLNKYRNK